MRPQQNRRMRGRAGNNSTRRNSSPLTRSYESNGPDVKIRGTPQHIADKYAALARDAQASGDYVTAENYLQHAEHYMRIILSVQAQTNTAPPTCTDVDEEKNTPTTDTLHSEALSGSNLQQIEGIPLELAFVADDEKELSSSLNNESTRVEHSRKPIRRRLSRKVDAAPSLIERGLSLRSSKQEEKTLLAIMSEETEI